MQSAAPVAATMLTIIFRAKRATAPALQTGGRTKSRSAGGDFFMSPNRSTEKAPVIDQMTPNSGAAAMVSVIY